LRVDTSEYDRTIEVPTGKKQKDEYTIKQLVVQLKANSIWLLDRPNTHEVENDAVEPSLEQANF
jgi:hypothetical protein